MTAQNGPVKIYKVIDGKKVLVGEAPGARSEMLFDSITLEGHPMTGLVEPKPTYG